MSGSPLLVVPPACRFTGDALRAAVGAVALARGEQAAVLVSNVIDDDAHVLGARELLGTRRWRRATTGRTATVHGRVLHHVLALPASRLRGASDSGEGAPFERMVEVLRQGFSRCGLGAQRFGADFLAYEGRPGTLLGWDADAAGTLLLEAFTGLDNPVLSARAGQKPPLALAELLDASAPELLLGSIAAGIAEGLVLAARETALGLQGFLPVLPGPEPDATVSESMTPGGLLAVVVRGHRVWLRGDFLASIGGLDRAEQVLGEAIRLGELGNQQVTQRLAEGGPLGVEPELVVQLAREAWAEDRQRYSSRPSPK